MVQSIPALLPRAQFSLSGEQWSVQCFSVPWFLPCAATTVNTRTLQQEGVREALNTEVRFQAHDSTHGPQQTWILTTE